MRYGVFASMIVLICFASSSAFAGRVFGDIKLGGKPAPAGLSVKITVAPPALAQGGAVKTAPPTVDSTVTDAFGSYKLNVKEVGKCVLTLVYEKKEYVLEVYSYKNATRYDMILERKDGAFSLRRK